MIFFVLSVLFLSMFLYIVLAGADFGAGILEIFKGKELREIQEKMITKAMGPVWEANHIWLILVLVIMFVGFPGPYRLLTISLHIPITMILIGIIGRGTAFTFRHYDAVKGKSQAIYSIVFSFSSLWTSMWIGITVGAMTLGRITEDGSFYNVYIENWLNPFSFLMGMFISSLFAYVASTFLVSESHTYQTRELFKKRVTYSCIVSVMIGTLLFIDSFFNPNIINEFLNDKVTMIFLFISSSILLFQWIAIRNRSDSYLKFLGVIQLFLIFSGWVVFLYPNFYFRDGSIGVNIFQGAAPDATIKQLGIALAIGVVVIFPPYLYLMNIFKRNLR